MNQNDVTIGIKADAGQLTKEMTKVSQQAEALGRKFGTTGGKINQIGGAIKDKLGGAISGAVSGLGGLGKALSTAFTVGLGPIGLVSAAIAAIGGVFETLMGKSQKFGDAVTKIFTQLGASISYVLDPSNWGTGFADGLREAWKVAGEMADAADAAGTYTMEWEAKAAELQATLAQCQATMTDSTATTKEQTAAVAAATKAAEDYERESRKYIDARRAEIEAMVKQIANTKKLTLTQEELNFLIEEGIMDTDKLNEMGGKYADFADAMSDATQKDMLAIRKEIKQTEREASTFARSVSRLVNKDAKGKVKVDVTPTIPEGSIKDIKNQIKRLQEAQELTLPMSVEFLNIEGQIDELNRKLKGESDRLEPIKAQLAVPDIAATVKNLKLVNSETKKLTKQTDGVGELTSQFSNLATSIGELSGESRTAAVAVKLLAAAEQIAAMAAAIKSAAGGGEGYTVAPRIIAAAAAVTSAIASIQALSKQTFATGGIIGGPYETGDRTLIRANAGEMVINKSQQAKLWRMISSGGAPTTGNNVVTFRVEGRDLVGVLEAYKLYNSRSI